MSRKVIINNISLPYKLPAQEALDIASHMLAPLSVRDMEIRRRSVDARKKYDIRFVWSVCAETDASDDEIKRAGAAVYASDEPAEINGTVPLTGRPVIAGFGPCGMFCALTLAEHGYRPVVLERGGDVDARAVSVKRFFETGDLDGESHVQFGAGGAGTFSDGKLTTRIGDRRCDYILQTFCGFGAPRDILTDSKPHIGTDRLRSVVAAAAARVTALGGEILYNTRLDGFGVRDGEIISVRTSGGELGCGALVLACGHSARDTYAMLREAGVQTENKPFSVGLRIEHLRADIDRALYGDCAGDPLLGAASYNFSARRGSDCAYTFCMCPGGKVIAAASEEGGVVVNGMSDYLRGGENSNCAVCVNVSPDDPISFQRSLERRAYELGGGGFRAPVQTFGSFCRGVRDSRLGKVRPSYTRGETALCDLSRLFDDHIVSMLKFGISRFGYSLPGFDRPDALLTGVESRTSAPLRILRGDDLCAPGFSNLYPCGEGAGYSGGIMSSAADGIRGAEAIMGRYLPA